MRNTWEEPSAPSSACLLNSLATFTSAIENKTNWWVDTVIEFIGKIIDMQMNCILHLLKIKNTKIVIKLPPRLANSLEINIGLINLSKTRFGEILHPKQKCRSCPLKSENYCIDKHLKIQNWRVKVISVLATWAIYILLLISNWRGGGPLLLSEGIEINLSCIKESYICVDILIFISLNCINSMLKYKRRLIREFGSKDSWSWL